jgi:hypothetical protein
MDITASAAMTKTGISVSNNRLLHRSLFMAELTRKGSSATWRLIQSRAGEINAGRSKQSLTLVIFLTIVALQAAGR